MTTKTKPRRKIKKLPVDWAPVTTFRIAPKVVCAARDRLLKTCTIAIATAEPVPFEPGRSAAAEA